MVELEYADETGQTLKRSLRSALVNLTSSEPDRCGECWRQSSGGDERKFTGGARKIFQVQGLLVQKWSLDCLRLSCCADADAMSASRFLSLESQ